MKLTIDPVFHGLIPPISSEEYQLLEESILKEGCREKIVIWNDCILDGHNRYEICLKHDIKFGTDDRSFENEEKAKFWIIRNQLARRNLPPQERVRLALLLKSAIEEKAKERQIRKPKSVLMNSTEQKPIDTRKEVAKAAGVSEDTIRKSEIIEKEATEEIKEAVRKGEMSVNKAFKIVKGNDAKTHPKPKKKKLSKLFKLQETWMVSTKKTQQSFINWLKERREL
jgi:hypothetical protein